MGIDKKDLICQAAQCSLKNPAPLSLNSLQSSL